tara:strand:+ start:1029 stop:1277 length:249 start_codon:yes stop_codon:yes gene_type:complete
MKCPINPKHGELSIIVHIYDRDTQVYCKICKEKNSDKIQDLLIELMYWQYELGKTEERVHLLKELEDYEDREITIQHDSRRS